MQKIFEKLFVSYFAEYDGFDQFYYYHSNSIGAYRIKNRYIIFYSSIAKKGR